MYQFQPLHNKVLGMIHFFLLGSMRTSGVRVIYIFLFEKWLHKERPNVIIDRVECPHPLSSSQDDSPCCVYSMDACAKHVG